MTSARTLAAVWSAKAAAGASRALGRGGGTAVGGLVGLSLQPALVRDLAGGLGHGSVLISGTNGKTTTASLVSATVEAAGLQPLANASGSNLMRGIAATLTAAAGPTGRAAAADRRLGVFEVDEATLPYALRDLRPRVVVLTNLFRDQLDRYGEVESLTRLWRESLEAAPPDLALVLNADDPTVASLGEGRDNVLYFGLADAALDRGSLDHASDAVTCGCGTPYTFSRVYFSQLGIWHCDGCGRARPEPSVTATNVAVGDGHSLRFQLVTPDGGEQIEMALGGLYNVYNALAAAAAAHALGLPAAATTAALQSAAAAFGRQESFAVDGKRVDLFLAKNPAGLNQVLATLCLDPGRDAALIILNDGIADGRDVSWIWDADFEVAAGQFGATVAAGRRAADLALRLKYAEWPEPSFGVEPAVPAALDAALARTPAGGSLSIVPTYTAMLEVRALLAKRAGRAPFWQQ